MASLVVHGIDYHKLKDRVPLANAVQEAAATYVVVASDKVVSVPAAGTAYGSTALTVEFFIKASEKDAVVMKLQEAEGKVFEDKISTSITALSSAYLAPAKPSETATVLVAMDKITHEAGSITFSVVAAPTYMP